ncbi:hypothetical protein BDV35DRAFT_296314 [Aspergillus flavus]|uniref:Uncharacterized protein n=1 Tax=Aspergillus flavus TaxID=5059 RepID=A0A5N6HCI7_ASPFL|nr:hypothetical protein BDV35DRAFT_296314 [Aspergillus flavus]
MFSTPRRAKRIACFRLCIHSLTYSSASCLYPKEKPLFGTSSLTGINPAGNKDAEFPRITEIIASVIVSLVPETGHRMLHCTEIIFPSSTAGYYYRQGCSELMLMPGGSADISPGYLIEHHSIRPIWRPQTRQWSMLSSEFRCA